ncbi:hypothetical protein ACFVTM_08820 [Arthrobacter sp. NPDC058130]
MIFRIDNSVQRDVEDDEAAALRIEPDEFNLGITELGPQGI